MSKAKRFALMLLVLGAVSVSIGLTTTQSPATAEGTTAVAASTATVVMPAAEAQPDQFVGQGDFSTDTSRVGCTLCMSLICHVQGAACGGGSCPGTCRVCNGQFNCWKIIDPE